MSAVGESALHLDLALPIDRHNCLIHLHHELDTTTYPRCLVPAFDGLG